MVSMEPCNRQIRSTHSAQAPLGRSNGLYELWRPFVDFAVDCGSTVCLVNTFALFDFGALIVFLFVLVIVRPVALLDVGAFVQFTMIRGYAGFTGITQAILVPFIRIELA